MRTSTVGIVVVLLVVVFGAVWYFTKPEQGTSAVTNFEECVAAGYPIEETVPPQCRTPDGTVFVQTQDTDASERAKIPSKTEQVSVDSGLKENRGTEPVVAFRETVRSADAPWLRVIFDESNLGKRSFVTVTSLADGDSQRLDASALAEWDNASAYFNGDAVEVALTVAPGESGIFFRIKEILAGVVADTPEPTGSEE